MSPERPQLRPVHRFTGSQAKTGAVNRNVALSPTAIPAPPGEGPAGMLGAAVKRNRTRFVAFCSGSAGYLIGF